MSELVRERERESGKTEEVKSEGGSYLYMGLTSAKPFLYSQQCTCIPIDVHISIQLGPSQVPVKTSTK